MNIANFPGRPSCYALLGLLLGFGGTAFAALDDDPVETARVSESRFYATEGRQQSRPDRVSTDEYRASAAGRDARTRGAAQKSSGSELRSPNTDFWFYTADVILFADEDEDGYFYGVDLLFDADTVYAEAAVYAVLYLSLDGGPWLEYAATEVFNIYGATSDDEFVVVTELLAGYPSGSYDILIELFDTYDNAFVADYGPANSSALSFLPLEDAERDAPYVPPPTSTTVIVDQGGGGAADTWLLLLLAAGVLRLRRRSRVQG